MEPNNMQAKIAKKFWHMVRVAIFMLKKGFSKTKLLSDLNIMMKGGKIAGKAIRNLMFPHGHHDHHTHTTSDLPTTTTRRHIDEYEFSCSNTPTHHFNFFKRRNHHQIQMLSASQSPVSDEVMTADAITKALEIMQSVAASPALPGFGRSMVRELRITDSPFPLNNGNDDNEVDEAADEFIKKFYKNLRKQNLIAAA